MKPEFSHLPVTPGPVSAHQPLPGGLRVTCAQATTDLVVYNDRILRVTTRRSVHEPTLQYAVVANPTPAETHTHESSDEISIRTAHFAAVLNRRHAALTVYNSHGAVLCQDEANFPVSWIGEQVSAYKKLQPHERFVGLGEKTGGLDRRGHGYTNWNTDAYAYHATTDPLYSSVPFYIGIHSGVVYGIYLNNSHRSQFSFGASNNRFTSFTADAGVMDYFIITGNTIPEIIAGYTWLTGRMELPPQWSIGYQQCRYSYYPDHEVRSVARTFREKQIPADAIVLDIHYMDQYKIFTWDPKHFPDPKKMIGEIKDLGFEVVLMCDPGIKTEPGYEPYDDGVRNEVFLKYHDGENYSGQVWPGWCHFPDFTNPAARAWWAEKFRAYVDLGVEGFWNDMNEIATWGHMLPDNLMFNFDGEISTTRQGRNLYGFQMARSTYEGTKKLLKGKRPFNLTRSGFAGVQRYSAVWTGDNVAYDDHMMLGVRIVNSMGLSGIAFAGYDVGGFVGETGTNLYARWISIGAFSPFFRSHTVINSRDSEPWSYGEEVEQIARNYIRFRYQLMPYIYSLFYEAVEAGMPVQRSLAIEYPHRPEVFDGQFQQQYLFGPSILVAPVESNRYITRVFLPEGQWYYLFDGSTHEGNTVIYHDSPLHKLPVFIRGGSIIPMQAPVMNTKELTDELIVHVYNGRRDSTFKLFEDDRSTYAYQQGKFQTRLLSFEGSAHRLTLGAAEGSFESPYKKLKLVLHGFGSLSNVLMNNQHVNLAEEKLTFFLPLEKFDPIYNPPSMGEEQVKVLTLALTREAVEVSW